MDVHTHVLLQGDIIVDYDEQLLKESAPYRAIRATAAVRRALEFGFTSLRDLETEGAGYADVDKGNPLTDIAVLQKIAFVMKDGRVFKKP